MRIERGEHMLYPPKFENIEAWQWACEIARKNNERNVTLNP